MHWRMRNKGLHCLCIEYTQNAKLGKFLLKFTTALIAALTVKPAN